MQVAKHIKLGHVNALDKVYFYKVYLPLQADTSRVVWSWHSSDPSDVDSIPQHQFQGTTSINLLGGLNKDFTDPLDSDSFTINFNNVSALISKQRAQGICL